MLEACGEMDGQRQTDRRRRGGLRRLLEDRRGGVMITMALAIIPLCVVIGLAIDTARGFLVKSTRIPHLDPADTPEGRGNAGETADPFFHPSRPSGRGYLIQRNNLIRQPKLVRGAGRAGPGPARAAIPIDPEGRVVAGAAW